MHGVGDPIPGSTVKSLARTAGERDAPLRESQDVVWLADRERDKHFIKTFPAHICDLSWGSQRIQMTEVYWGDVSKILHGWLGVVIGVLQILFGLRFLAFVAADQEGWISCLMKWLGLHISRIIHGPVLAINFLLLLLVVTICLNHFTNRDSAELAANAWHQSGDRRSTIEAQSNQELSRAVQGVVAMGAYIARIDSRVIRAIHWRDVIAGAICCGIAFLLSTTGWRVTNTRVFERFWFWVKVGSLFLIGVLIFKTFFLADMIPRSEFSTSNSGLLWICEVLILLLGLFWFVLIGMLTLLLACWGIALFDRRLHRKPIHLAFLLPALAVGAWSHGLLLFWLFLVDRLDIFFHLPDLPALFDGASVLLGIQFLMGSIIGIAAAISTLGYVIWRQENGIREFEMGNPPPRLIVHSGVQLILGLCAIVGSVLVLSIGYAGISGHNYHQYWWGQLLAETNRYAMSMVVPMGMLFVFVIPKLRPVFGIVLEIVNHFFFRSLLLDGQFDDDDEFDIRETSNRKGTIAFTKRELIVNRMMEVLWHFSANQESNQKPELVIISHSQGTVVSLETLNRLESKPLRQKFSHITLVTMGSPFSHLYQHFFPHYYPSLDSPQWQALQKNLDCWVNIFRIDDPVGTSIDFPQGFLYQPNRAGSTPLRSGCSNRPVGGRGHINYFNDREVLDIIHSELLPEHWQKSIAPKTSPGTIPSSAQHNIRVPSESASRAA